MTSKHRRSSGAGRSRPDRGRGGSAPGRASPRAEAAAAGLAGSRWLNEARSAAPADDPELDDLDRSIEADRAARQAREAAGSRARRVPSDDDA